MTLRGTWEAMLPEWESIMSCNRPDSMGKRCYAEYPSMTVLKEML
jgi:hypothetical protein